MSAQFGNLEWAENYICSIWKSGGNGELYPLNLEILRRLRTTLLNLEILRRLRTTLLNLEIWRQLRTISVKSKNLEVTENYIHST